MFKAMNKTLLKLHIQGTAGIYAAQRKLREKDGSFFTENGLTIVIVVVIAAIILTAVVALFKDTIFPQLGNKIDDFFSIS